jgi:hypothetical protein
MNDYSIICRIERINFNLGKLGFKMTRGYNNYIAVTPKDVESLPMYSRDATLFNGTLEELESWITGVEWARSYDALVFGKNHDKNRAKKEQQYLCKRVFDKLSGVEENKEK